MKVAVLGSLNQPPGGSWELRNEKHFADTCRNIGKVLADTGCSLVVPRLKGNNAEDYVCRAYTENPNRHEVIDVSKVVGFDTWRSAHVFAAITADAVILIGGTRGTYEAGRVAIELGKMLIPIICFGGATEKLRPLLGRSRLSGTLLDFMGVEPLENPAWYKQIRQIIVEHLSFPKCLIIHGRGRDREVVRDIIVNSGIPNFPEPIIMGDYPQGAKPNPDLFTSLGNRVHAAIVVITPDDIAVGCRNEDGGLRSPLELERPRVRARENVWIELGWFWGKLGRERVILIKHKSVRLPSDLDGAHYIEYQDSPLDRKEEIERNLSALREVEA